MSAPPAPGSVRLARVSDVRALSQLYALRPEVDRRYFHPFPEGALATSLTLFALLVAQRLHGILVHIRPSWGFLFVVHVPESGRTIDGFVYYRVRRRTSEGFAANIGPYVAPAQRGRGIAPVLVVALAEEARRRGVAELEGFAEPSNVAVIRMGRKVGFRRPEAPPSSSVEEGGTVVVRDRLALGAARPKSLSHPDPARVTDGGTHDA